MRRPFNTYVNQKSKRRKTDPKFTKTYLDRGTKITILPKSVPAMIMSLEVLKFALGKSESPKSSSAGSLYINDPYNNIIS